MRGGTLVYIWVGEMACGGNGVGANGGLSVPVVCVFMAFGRR